MPAAALLIGLGAGLAWLLIATRRDDSVTAHLAASPAGVDIAAIGRGGQRGRGFVVAPQLGRLLRGGRSVRRRRVP